MAKRLGCGTFVLSLVLVALLALSGWWLLSNLVRVVDHKPVDAVVVDLVPSVDSDGDTVYAPVYEYTVDGTTYRYKSKVSLGGVVVPDVGDHRTLLYNPADPADARVRNWFLLLVLPGIGFVIPLLILGVVLVMTLRRSRRSAALPPPAFGSGEESSGADRMRIEAMFMGAEPSQMDAAGRVRYRATASAEVDGVTQRFYGEWQDDDPTLLFMARGNTVDVLFDPNDPASYELVMPDPDEG